MTSLETWGPDDAATYPTVLITTQSGAMHIIRSREMTSTRSYVADPVVEQIPESRDGFEYVDHQSETHFIPGTVFPTEGAPLQRLRRDGEALRLLELPQFTVGERATLYLASLSAHPDVFGTERNTTPIVSITVLPELD